MRGALFVVVGLVAVLFAGCASGCLFLLGVESATHQQSPIRSWPLAAGASLHETLDVDQSGWPSPAIDVELAIHPAPHETTPVACTLQVSATTAAGIAARHDEAPVTRPSRCTVSIDAPGPTRISVEATNLSDRSVTVWVTPAVPGFDRRIKIAWAVLAATTAFGAGLAVLGVLLRRRERIEKAAFDGDG